MSMLSAPISVTTFQPPKARDPLHGSPIVFVKIVGGDRPHRVSPTTH